MLPWAVPAGNPRNLGTSQLRPRELAAAPMLPWALPLGDRVLA